VAYEIQRTTQLTPSKTINGENYYALHSSVLEACSTRQTGASNCRTVAEENDGRGVI
jgi:hypothetical protein